MLQVLPAVLQDRLPHEPVATANLELYEVGVQVFRVISTSLDPGLY